MAWDAFYKSGFNLRDSFCIGRSCEDPAWDDSVEQEVEELEVQPEQKNQQQPEHVIQKPEQVTWKPEQVTWKPDQVSQKPEQVTQKPELGTDMKMQGAARAGEEGWSSSHRGT